MWWLIHKDMVSECRARQVWPAMLLLGIVIAVLFSLQVDLLPEQKQRIIGSLFWLAVLFASLLALDRSFASEREEGCWEALLLYRVTPAGIYLAKLVVNVISLAALQCVLVPLFVVLSDVPLLAHPWALVTVALLGNLGIAAVGTLLSALAGGIQQTGNLLALLVMPLLVPVVLAAAEATRLITENDLGAEWWRWVQLLAAFAIVFIVAGTLLFEFVVEE